MIAHRLSTVEKADKIIVIKEGKVEEEGSHLDLLDKGGLYASLVSKQMMLQNRSQEKSSTRPSDDPPQCALSDNYGAIETVYGSCSSCSPTDLVDVDLNDYN